MYVKYKSINPRHYEDYLPCLFCYGFVNEKEPYSHIRVCKHRTELKDEIKSVRSQCRMLLEGGESAYHQNTRVKKVLDIVVSGMRERANQDVKKTVEQMN